MSITEETDTVRMPFVTTACDDPYANSKKVILYGCRSLRPPATNGDDADGDDHDETNKLSPFRNCNSNTDDDDDDETNKLSPFTHQWKVISYGHESDSLLVT